MDLVKQIDHNRAPALNQFGLSVDNKFAKVPARILDPPEIEYANRICRPAKGVWRGEGMEYLKPTTAPVWGVINADRRTQRSAVEEFCKTV